MLKKRKDDGCVVDSPSTQLAKVLWYYNMLPHMHCSDSKFKIVCPFHDGDVNPSLLVNLAEGNWFCFGCSETGDAQKFVSLMEKKYNGVNDLQACRKFYQILKSDKCSSIHIEPTSQVQQVQSSKELYDEAYDYYHGLRKVDWCNDDEDEVVQARGYMEQRGFSPKTLARCKAKVTYNNSYGLIFPMLDNGKFRGWVCRTMRKDIEKRRKYLYNKGFARATTVVGSYGTKDYVFVVEGYMDRLKFIQNGETNVVAILGWKMSAQQKDKLSKSGVTKVISALDNDECGRKGTEYLKRIFGKQNVVRWCYLKGIKDPGDMEPDTFTKMYKKTMQKYQNKFNVKKE